MSKYIPEYSSSKFSIYTFSSNNFNASAPLDQEQYPPQLQHQKFCTTVISTRMKSAPNASTATNSIMIKAAPHSAAILTSCNITLLLSTQQHQIQLQHYLAAFDPTVSSLAVNNLRLAHLKRSSSKPITRACPYSTSSCTWGANVEDRFFGPRGVTSLATHAPSTYYSFFG